MTFWQFVVAHSTAVLAVALLLFKTATNAFPPKGQPFVFSQWFMEWMRELAQQAPDKVPALSPDQVKLLAAHPTVHESEPVIITTETK